MSQTKISTLKGVRRVLLASGLGLAFLLAGAGSPAAAQVPACYPNCVGGTTVVRDTAGPAAVTKASPVAQVRGVSATRSQLPVTGGDVAGLAAAGAMLIVGGAAAVTGSRRRRDATA